MRGRRRLVAYVTSHGFGHLNRTVAVLNRLPADVPLTVRCHPDLFGAWRERLTRDAELEPHVSDFGAVNPPGDSASTDGPETLRLAAEVHRAALPGVDAEASYLRDCDAGAVLCDAPFLPLVAARRAGVPGYVLANFTWADIYAPYARAADADARRFVADVRAAYRQAAGFFRAQPGLRMAWLGRLPVDVGLVVTPGRDRGGELRRSLGLTAKERLVYFYIGRYGQAGMAWERLAKLEARGVHFVGFHAAPSGAVPNLHVVPPNLWTGADLAASADAMVAKAGYGTTCEAMAGGTPMIYPPRRGFAEHRALDRGLRAWGGGLPASSRDFAGLKLVGLIARAFALGPGPPPFPLDGAAAVARALTEVCRRG